MLTSLLVQASPSTVQLLDQQDLANSLRIQSLVTTMKAKGSNKSCATATESVHSEKAEQSHSCKEMLANSGRRTVVLQEKMCVDTFGAADPYLLPGSIRNHQKMLVSALPDESLDLRSNSLHGYAKQAGYLQMRSMPGAAQSATSGPEDE